MAADRDPPTPRDPSPPSLAGADWLEAPGLQAVFDLIEKGGFDARAVGGVVRNALLGEPIHDIDIATTASPDEVIRLARSAGLRALETGAAHGTITVLSDHTAFEVTTLRRDVETFGRHAVVAFTGKWEEDARRRDFTINALYCDRQGQVYDPVGGYPDLVSRRVRFIGDPVQRIREDYLRILRFFRFHATYGAGGCDADGLAACVAERNGLSTLSAERIRSEMLRLLVAPGALTAADVIVRTGIGEIILGGRGDVALLSRVAETEAALGQRVDALLRLAAWSCETPGDASAMAARLRLSNGERAQLEAAMLMDPALDPHSDLMQAKACRFRLSPDTFARAYIMAWARSGADPTDKAWRSRFDELSSWQVPDMPFKGADLVALGVPPGPNVGTALQQFRDWWIEAGFPDDSELLRRRLSAFAKPFIK